MKVLVNARFFGLPYSHARFRFLLETLLKIKSNRPIDSICIISDLPDAAKILNAHKNSLKSDFQLDIVPSKKIGYWSLKIWYDVTLKSMVRKIKPDIILHADHFCSLTIDTPQIMIGDEILQHQLQRIGGLARYLLAKRWPAMISKVMSIYFWSSFVQGKYIRQHPNTAEKSIVLDLIPLPSVVSISWEEKQLLLDQFASGKEYFLALAEGADASERIMNLLKGFSWFKKRFQSNMKLFLCVSDLEKVLKSLPLESYKYKHDVLLFGMKEYVDLLPASYAMIYLSGPEHMPLGIAEAFQSGIPVIAQQDPLSQNMFMDSVDWNTASDPENWGMLMGNVFKDETSRKQLINKGFEFIESLAKSQFVPLRPYE